MSADLSLGLVRVPVLGPRLLDVGCWLQHRLAGDQRWAMAMSGCGKNLAGQSLCPSGAPFPFLPRGTGGPLSLLVPSRCPEVRVGAQCRDRI